jgi:hypothetical protein
VGYHTRSQGFEGIPSFLNGVVLALMKSDHDFFKVNNNVKVYLESGGINLSKRTFKNYSEKHSKLNKSSKTVWYVPELLVDSLFKPGIKLNPEHKPKYIYLLAYAASVCEVSPGKKGQPTRKTLNKDELKATIQAIEKVHSICNINKGSAELIAELSTLYQCIR